ncbi:hypothetical protein [Phaeovulum vinaykumarii]|uniref:Uncharacterized protein n=1 Tax=Phaeovulum vinaykumarii TaxID=407234 RepID=A0A1N7JNU7_9RHOB|nr:hypothetical protein [Phaeovulum vinaykumarii]SIS50926.1 hypothetical protein SAMN05421795_101195 [Phaeovulum vinaykumarii]SOB90493.1 hypothetical protein SAMN05878426_101195 [Phaeovulum vinaykumarii]
MSGWWDWIAQFGRDHGGAITVLGLAVAVLAMLFAGLALRPRRGLSEAERLCDHRDWPARLAALSPNRADVWFAGIARARGFADRVYGEKLISWRAFDRALLFAFLYPITALLLGWGLFDAGRLDGSEFLPEGLAW